MSAHCDLLEVLGTVSMEGYCSSSYWEWEANIAKPALSVLGYTDIKFYNGEVDSFGPLSRIVRCIKDGVSVQLMYG